MKYTLLKNLAHIVLYISCIGVCSQENKVIEEASKNYDDYAFIDARDIYLRLIKKGFYSPEILQKLGDSYYWTANYSEACLWYSKLLKKGNDNLENIDAEYHFRYAQSLKSIGRYNLADIQMDKFNQINRSDSRGEIFVKDRDYLKDIDKQSGNYKISKVFFNSELQDFGPSFWGNQLVFSSNRENRTGDYIHDWNDQPFLDLFVVKNPMSETPDVKRFSDKMNTPYHESTSVFTASGDVIYFTRNNSDNSKLKRDSKGTAKLKIFRSTRTDIGWSIPEELPFNSDEFSTAHPALNANESKLYFASDRPGTYGLSDIWMVDIYPDGGFGEPINLGEKINTEARETFPFINQDNGLFYASEGQVGLGGLDVFTTKLDNSGNVGITYNVGKPVNSNADDFGLIINNQLGIGYFASNRSSGMGNDDIYAITLEKKSTINCSQNITGVTKNVKTDQIIPLATVELRNINNEIIDTAISDNVGRFSFTEIDCKSTFVIRAKKTDYEPSEVMINTSLEPDATVNRDLYLKPPLKLNVGDDLADILELNPIYFDFDKHNIRQDAALELEKVVGILKKYPKLKIDVRSHTDSRAPDQYNLTLSQRRNMSTLRYIINQGGIGKNRLTGRGYGETQLINACGNDIECTEEEHQLNRRSEFIIVSK